MGPAAATVAMAIAQTSGKRTRPLLSRRRSGTASASLTLRRGTAQARARSASVGRCRRSPSAASQPPTRHAWSPRQAACSGSRTAPRPASRDSTPQGVRRSPSASARTTTRRLVRRRRSGRACSGWGSHQSLGFVCTTPTITTSTRRARRVSSTRWRRRPPPDDSIHTVVTHLCGAGRACPCAYHSLHATVPAAAPAPTVVHTPVPVPGAQRGGWGGRRGHVRGPPSAARRGHGGARGPRDEQQLRGAPGRA